MFGFSKSEREAKAARILGSLESHCAKEYPHLAPAPIGEAERGRQELQIKEIQSLYRHLDILDSKTSVMLRFNGLIATAFIFLIGFNHWSVMEPTLASISSHAGLLVAIASAAFCLTIVSITARFLEHAESLDDELNKLALAVARRVSYYRAAWFLSCVSLALMVLTFWPAIFG